MTYLSTVSSYSVEVIIYFFLEIYAFMNVNGHDVFVKCWTYLCECMEGSEPLALFHSVVDVRHTLCLSQSNLLFHTLLLAFMVSLV